MLDLGYMELQSGSGVDVHVYYDATFSPVGDSQPLINGPRGYCLDLTNTSGGNATVTLINPSGTSRTYVVGQGDPVTTGKAKALTVAQMNSLGFQTRGDVSGFQLQ